MKGSIVQRIKCRGCGHLFTRGERARAKDRPTGMCPKCGHITTTQSTNWAVILSFTDPATGKYKQEWHAVNGAKKDAERKKNELVHKWNNGTHVDPSRKTLSEYLEQWIKDRVMGQKAPRTAESYAAEIRRHIIPRLGHHKLSALRPEHLETFYTYLRTKGRRDGTGGLSNTTVFYVHSILKMALDHAVKTGRLEKNPAKHVAPARPPKHPVTTTVTPEDIGRFVEAAQLSRYCALYLTGLGTGMRLSEALGLRWRHVDLDQGIIAVVETLHRSRGEWELREPKSESGKRAILLMPSHVKLLLAHREQQTVTLDKHGLAFSPDVLVFSHPDGKPYDRHSVAHDFKRMVHSAGLPADLHFHSLRHTQITDVAAGGVPAMVIAQRSGHSDGGYTEKRYMHPRTEMQRAVVAVLETAYGSHFQKLLPEKSISTSISTEGAEG